MPNVNAFSSLLRTARRRGVERGAIAVEFAIVALLLVPIVCGMIDMGTLLQKDATLETAVRQAARSVVQACTTTDSLCQGGNRYNDDQRVMTALAGALRNSGADIERIVVYRVASSDPNGNTPAPCQVGTAVADLCNVYDASWLTAPSSWFSCGYGAASYYKSCGRYRVGNNSDYVGVWVKLRHSYVTGLFGPGRTLSKRAVFRLEPQPTPPERIRKVPPPPGATALTTLAGTTVPIPTYDSTLPPSTIPTTSTTTTTIYVPTTASTSTTSTSSTTTTTLLVPSSGPTTTDVTTTTTTTLPAITTTTIGAPTTSTTTTTVLTTTTRATTTTTTVPTTRRPIAG
jgi:Flp pilus assembly protein TadG